MIDLTNSTRYYSAIDLKKDGIKYVKVSISLKLETYVYQYVCKLMKFAIPKILNFGSRFDVLGGLRFQSLQLLMNSYMRYVSSYTGGWGG